MMETVEPLPAAVAAARAIVGALETGSARPVQLQKTASSTFGRCVLGLGALSAGWTGLRREPCRAHSHAIFRLCSWPARICDCEHADVSSRSGAE